MSDLSRLPSLPHVIAAFGISARKNLGQHFLLDSAITDLVARYAGPLSSYHIVEIGPGPGGLTRSLLKAGATSLTVIEKDERCLAALAQIQAAVGERLTILHGDALETDVTATISIPRKIVANLPYNIGTALLLNWLDIIYREPTAFASLTLMFQKEVAERIVAAPGGKEYGRLSVLSQFLCECRLDMELPPEAFSPPPKVSSVVVTLTPRSKPLVAVSKEALETVMASAFGQRRKMLRSALKGLKIPPETLLQAADIDGSLRAEALDVPTLCRLAQCYAALNH